MYSAYTIVSIILTDHKSGVFIHTQNFLRNIRFMGIRDSLH